MKDLSIRWQWILAYTRRFVREHGYSPSIREIQQAGQLQSTSSTAYILDRLQERGLVYREPGVARSLVIVEQRPARRSPCPLCGCDGGHVL